MSFKNYLNLLSNIFYILTCFKSKIEITFSILLPAFKEHIGKIILRKRSHY